MSRVVSTINLRLKKIKQGEAPLIKQSPAVSMICCQR